LTDCGLAVPRIIATVAGGLTIVKATCVFIKSLLNHQLSGAWFGGTTARRPFRASYNLAELLPFADKLLSFAPTFFVWPFAFWLAARICCSAFSQCSRSRPG
jgi:hypothetical protein